MSERVVVASTHDLEPGEGTVVEVAGTRLALFNVDGDFHAVGNGCPHLGGPLGRGDLDGSTVRCPWHGSAFDVTSGSRLDRPMPADEPVASYEVTVEGTDVVIEVRRGPSSPVTGGHPPPGRHPPVRDDGGPSDVTRDPRSPSR